MPKAAEKSLENSNFVKNHHSASESTLVKTNKKLEQNPASITHSTLGKLTISLGKLHTTHDRIQFQFSYLNKIYARLCFVLLFQDIIRSIGSNFNNSIEFLKAKLFSSNCQKIFIGEHKNPDSFPDYGFLLHQVTQDFGITNFIRIC